VALERIEKAIVWVVAAFAEIHRRGRLRYGAFEAAAEGDCGSPQRLG